MLARVNSCAVVGLDGVLIEVEVDITNGLPAFNIVGLPDTAVQEARERVRSAIKNTGMPFPRTRITVNLAPADLPMRLMAYSPCYRREAGSAGRDTRGLLRVHEFDKVEIFAYATPEQAPAELEAMVARAESLIAGLGLAHRVIEICAGDQGQAHHRSYDLEVSSPGLDRELHKERELRWATGKLVHVWTREPVDGRREVVGRLESVEPDTLTLREAGESRRVPRDVVTKARLEVELGGSA